MEEVIVRLTEVRSDNLAFCFKIMMILKICDVTDRLIDMLANNQTCFDILTDWKVVVFSCGDAVSICVAYFACCVVVLATILKKGKCPRLIFNFSFCCQQMNRYFSLLKII